MSWSRLHPRLASVQEAHLVTAWLSAFLALPPCLDIRSGGTLVSAPHISEICAGDMAIWSQHLLCLTCALGPDSCLRGKLN